MSAAAQPPTELTHRARELALAAALVSYPDPEFGELLALAAHPVATALAAVIATPAGVADLQVRHGELFDRGGPRASLYETEYGRMRGMGKGHTLADLAGFYHAFGLTLDESRHELLDHLAVELEFYVVLLLKQAALTARADADGVEVVASARAKFLAEHLAGLAGAVAARPEVGADPVYGPVFAWCAALIQRECEVLQVTAAPLDFFPTEDDRAPMKCGAVQLPVVP